MVYHKYMKECDANGCHRIVKIKPYCSMHYRRLWRHGDANYIKFSRHGLKDSALYNTWKLMRQRCNNPNSLAYKDYGGRGIKVCERWGDFRNFQTDMSKKPNELSTLERIDNDGDYSPKNCCWATPKEQANNRRNSRFYTINDETKTIAQWAELLGLKYTTIHERLNRGDSIKMALRKV